MAWTKCRKRLCVGHLCTFRTIDIQTNGLTSKVRIPAITTRHKGIIRTNLANKLRRVRYISIQIRQPKPIVYKSTDFVTLYPNIIFKCASGYILGHIGNMLFSFGQSTTIVVIISLDSTQRLCYVTTTSRILIHSRLFIGACKFPHIHGIIKEIIVCIRTMNKPFRLILSFLRKIGILKLNLLYFWFTLGSGFFNAFFPYIEFRNGLLCHCFIIAVDCIFKLCNERLVRLGLGRELR